MNPAHRARLAAPSVAPLARHASRTAAPLLAALALTACGGPQPAGDSGIPADAGADDALFDAPIPRDVPGTDAPPGADAVDAPPTDGAMPMMTGTIRDVQHVVIFVQENRSFDNYFGALAGVRGYADPAAITLPTGRNVFHQPDGASEVLPFHTALQCVNDVDHGWDSGHTAWHSGAWDRWVPAKGSAALSGYSRADLGFYYALADAYTVMDAYHCSVFGPTNPNRMYLMTGTIDPDGLGGGPVTGNAEPPEGYGWTTYPERLQAAGVSWRVYQQFDNYDDNALAWFHTFLNASTTDPLYVRGLTRLTDLLRTFRTDVVNNTLPQVSWVVAPTQQSEHPPYALAAGQALTQQLLEALAANPAVARSTVFFLTYDENGGFYDHVPPPTPPAGTAGEFVGGLPIGLGNRVPMIVVSPWSRGGVVDSEVSDHTSILRFLETWTGVREPNISAWRRQMTGDLTSAFDFAHPDFTSPVLPTVANMSCRGAAPVVPSPQAIPAQETGSRPARALPYQPNVTAQMDCAAGRLHLTMTNTGTAALHVRIGANRFRTDGPWEHDVMPGAMVDDTFTVGSASANRYDLTAAGPNGFERQFAGDTSTACGALEVTSVLHADAGTVDLVYANTGSAAVTFTTTATRYRTDGPWTTAVPAGGTRTQTLDVGTMGQGWYSLRVTASSDSMFLRRFAGHLENGRASVTGL